MPAIENAAMQCIAEQAGLALESIKPSDTLGQLDLDSRDMEVIAVSIDNELGLHWPDSNLVNVLETSPGMTVQQYVDAVVQHLDMVPGLRERLEK